MLNRVVQRFPNWQFDAQKVEIIIFGSCNSGTTGQNGPTSLVHTTSTRGVPIVIGFTDVLNRQVFAAFQYLFFEEYSNYLEEDNTYPSLESLVSSVYNFACSPVSNQEQLIGDDNPVISGIAIVETN